MIKKWELLACVQGKSIPLGQFLNDGANGPNSTGLGVASLFIRE